MLGAALLSLLDSAPLSLLGTALLAAVEDGRAYLIFARPKDAPGAPMGALLKDALGVLGGKGGGGPDFAQGSGAPEKLDDALALAAHRLVHP